MLDEAYLLLQGRYGSRWHSGQMRYQTENPTGIAILWIIRLRWRRHHAKAAVSMAAVLVAQPEQVSADRDGHGNRQHSATRWSARTGSRVRRCAGIPCNFAVTNKAKKAALDFISDAAVILGFAHLS